MKIEGSISTRMGERGKEWTLDYRMTHYCVERQAQAFLRLKGMTAQSD